jgi:hypothetical protein
MIDRYKPIIFIGIMTVMLMVILLALAGCKVDDPFRGYKW